MLAGVDNQTVTYMYREPGDGGFGGVSGSLAVAVIEGPALPVSSLESLGFGYWFGRYAVTLNVDAP